MKLDEVDTLVQEPQITQCVFPISPQSVGLYILGEEAVVAEEEDSVAAGHTSGRPGRDKSTR